MIALRDGQNAHPTRVKISHGRRGAQKPGFGENTSLHYGYTLRRILGNSKSPQATPSPNAGGVTQCKKNTAGDCYESNRQKTQSSNTPAYWNVKPVFPTTWMKTRRINKEVLTNS